MQTFTSSAIGDPHEYRAWFSDRVKLVIVAAADDVAACIASLKK
jgi:hypothetical protein